MKSVLYFDPPSLFAKFVLKGKKILPEKFSFSLGMKAKDSYTVKPKQKFENSACFFLNVYVFANPWLLTVIESQILLEKFNPHFLVAS